MAGACRTCFARLKVASFFSMPSQCHMVSSAILIREFSFLFVSKAST